MRLPNSVHLARPWRIHGLVPDFRLEDVWALPTPGGPDDFPRLLRLIAAGGFSSRSSLPARVLWAIRMKAGALLGWDATEAGASMLRDRLPPDLPGAGFDPLPFRSLYRLEDEWAAEIANRTVHGVLHVGWVRDGDAWRGELAIYVKRRGRLGAVYMGAINPFRYLIVYPAMLRGLERTWLQP